MIKWEFNMNHKMYRIMLRRRFCKRGIFLVILFLLSFYAFILLFGNLQSRQVMHITDLNRCPACYGISICPELYSNRIVLETGHLWSYIFNTKNIYHGHTQYNERVVLKKLAHDWELKEFDTKICKTWDLKENCKPDDLLNVYNINEKIMQIVQYNISCPDTEPRKGLVLCPYSYGFYDLIKPLLDIWKERERGIKLEMINIWTILSINPEPLILQILPKYQGWPVSLYIGECGRLEVVTYEGQPISSLTHVPWHKKLKYAENIIEAALDFTFKHERFRFYLMDWSLDNIVVNKNDEISFVDLEDIIVLDKHISPQSDLPDWYQRYTREIMGSGFTFSIENICKHHLSDHNLWAACFIIAGDESPLLYPIPQELNTSKPHLEKLLSECLNGDDRFKAIIKLQHYITDMLMDEKIFGIGTIK